MVKNLNSTNLSYLYTGTTYKKTSRKECSVIKPENIQILPFCQCANISKISLCEYRCDIDAGCKGYSHHTKAKNCIVHTKTPCEDGCIQLRSGVTSETEMIIWAQPSFYLENDKTYPLECFIKQKGNFQFFQNSQ